MVQVRRVRRRRCGWETAGKHTSKTIEGTTPAKREIFSLVSAACCLSLCLSVYLSEESRPFPVSQFLS